VKAHTWELREVLDSYCSHIDRAECLCIVTSHFIHRLIHRKSEYTCTTHTILCALIKLVLLRPTRKDRFAALLTALPALFSPHKLDKKAAILFKVYPQVPPVELTSTRSSVVISRGQIIFSGTLCRVILSLPMQLTETLAVNSVPVPP